MINMSTNTTVKGEYVLQLKNAEGEVTYTTGLRPNLILDNFFDITTSQEAFYWTYPRTLRVGTGTNPPANNQTTLTNLLASVNETSYTGGAVIVDGNNWSTTATMVFQFPLGSVVGAVSELGLKLYGLGGATTVHTRALVTDTGGSPTTVTVTAADQLVITYKITVGGTDTAANGVINLGGTNYTWTTLRDQPSPSVQEYMYLLLNGNYSLNSMGGSSSVFGGVGVRPTSTQEVSGTFTTDRSTAGRIRKTISLSIAQGNLVGGIQNISGTSGGYFYKINFTPAIPKDATKIFTLTTETTLSRA